MLLLGPTGPGDAYAQGSANANATVRVGIVNGLTLLIDANLDFGTVANDVGTVSIPKTHSSAGRVRIRGQQQQNIDLTVTATANLVNGADAIPLTPGASYNTLNDASTSIDLVFTNGTSNTVRFKMVNNLPGNQAQAWIWLWGSILVDDQTLAAGTYTGTYNVSVVYP